MLRDMRRNGSQPKDTMHKAFVDMETGMAVVIKDATSVTLPAAETATNIYFATKERIPTGINAARVNMSDYDEDFVKIKANEFIGLERYTDGEKLATDQFKAADFGDSAVQGFAVAFGADGKAVKAKSSVPSKYVFDGFHNDNGHKLVVIRVEAEAVTNS